jgi:Ca2+-binding EF-hand superfamily protein
VVEVDSDSEDDFDDADLKKKFESQEVQRKITADFSDLDLDGDGSITMKELIAKLNPSASTSEREELEVIVSSARNFDLDGEGNINMKEMITCCSRTTTITKSSSTIIENKLTEEKGPVDYIEMKKMYQKQFNTRERAGFLKEFDLNKDGYVTMKEIKQRTQEKGWKRADFLKEVDVDGDGNIAIKEIITKLNPPNIEKKKAEKNEIVMRRPR